MTTFLHQTFQWVHHLLYDFLYKNKDTRFDGLFLMNSIWPTIFASLIYAIVCKFIGPKLMEKRKPYQLKSVIFWYNSFQVLCSAYIFYEVFDKEWFTTLKILKCQPVDYTVNPRSMRVVRAFYIYYLVKFVEYLDTIFFVLRKKNNQISLLHLYHHASMPVYMWFVLKTFAGGSWVLIPLENGFVHIVMYTYYLLAGLGPQVQKYLWWKKYITLIQMIQFALGIFHFIFVLMDSNPECNLRKTYIITGMGIAGLFYALFKQFYDEAYVENNGAKNEKTENPNENGIKEKPSIKKVTSKLN